MRTYKELQAQLKTMRNEGYDVRCKLNAKQCVLEAEVERLLTKPATVQTYDIQQPLQDVCQEKQTMTYVQQVTSLALPFVNAAKVTAQALQNIHRYIDNYDVPPQFVSTYNPFVLPFAVLLAFAYDALASATSLGKVQQDVDVLNVLTDLSEALVDMAERKHEVLSTAERTGVLLGQYSMTKVQHNLYPTPLGGKTRLSQRYIINSTDWYKWELEQWLVQNEGVYVPLETDSHIFSAA